MRDKSGNGPRTKGAQAERLAEAFLRRRGLRLRERNFRVRSGEIDLIMQEGDSIIFVEVRCRNNRLLDPAESVDAYKQRRLCRTAAYYLQSLQHTAPCPPCRFDVICITGHGSQIDWIRGAFEAEET